MRIYFRFILSLVYLSYIINPHPVGTDDSSDNNYNFEMMQRMSNKLPYIVVVVTDYSRSLNEPFHSKVCTGTMVRNDMVLTLASCLLTSMNELPDIEKVTVFERDSKGLQAIRIFKHDNFLNKAYDFALIVVERSKQTEFPQLPQRLDTFADIRDTCIMGGYGFKSAFLVSNFQIYHMNRTSVNIFTGSACGNGNIICLHLSRIMPCTEDQGSPIICKETLYALYIPRYNRFSTKCVETYITTFTPVYNVKEWVEWYMNKPIATFEWLNHPIILVALCVIAFLVMGGIYYVIVEVIQSKLDPSDAWRNTQRGTPLGEERDSGESLSEGSIWFSG